MEIPPHTKTTEGGVELAGKEEAWGVYPLAEVKIVQNGGERRGLHTRGPSRGQERNHTRKTGKKEKV